MSGDASEVKVQSLSSKQNWLNALEDKPLGCVCEFPFYSDAHIVSTFRDGLGPYEFLNPVPITHKPGLVNTAVVFRAEFYGTTQEHPDFLKTNDDLYHGGFLEDEFAAMTSLCLGVRIMAGGEIRNFRPGEDPYGTPVAWSEQPNPVVGMSHSRPVLPAVVGRASLDDLELLKTIPEIPDAQYVKLIRACRSYQSGLWAAESDPNLAWLMFVSSLETAAEQHKADEIPAEERLKMLMPELVADVEAVGGDELVTSVAGRLAHTFGPTSKFVDFTIAHMPEPPGQRPIEEWARVGWSKKKLKRALGKIYDYRSKALHGGIPFPPPMLGYPFPCTDGIPAETPSAGGAASMGGVWLAKDMPMNLNSFHHIVRGALLNWWRGLTEASSTAGRVVNRTVAPAIDEVRYTSILG